MSANPNRTKVDTRSTSGFRHLEPVSQPHSLHEISEALYRSFQGDDLTFRVSGCTIDAVPFVQAADGRYFLLNGQAVSEIHAESLGLDSLEECQASPECWHDGSPRRAVGAAG